MWYLIIPMVVIPILCVVTVVMCFIIFTRRNGDTQFEFARKLSSEIQDIRDFFLKGLKERTLEHKCERCGAIDPIGVNLLQCVHVILCKKCRNEWDTFARATKEYEDYWSSHYRLDAIRSGGFPIQANKFDDIVKEELGKEKRAIDAIKRIIAKWMNDKHKPSESIGLGSHSKPVEEPATES